MKLVLRPVEPGSVRISVDGQEVGYALTEWDERDPRQGAWRGYLWPAPDVHDTGRTPTAKFLRLRELRAELERWLEEQGPWWS